MHTRGETDGRRKENTCTEEGKWQVCRWMGITRCRCVIRAALRMPRRTAWLASPPQIDGRTKRRRAEAQRSRRGRERWWHARDQRLRGTGWACEARTTRTRAAAATICRLHPMPLVRMQAAAHILVPFVAVVVQALLRVA